MSTSWSDAAALAIGERIVSRAVVDGDVATWWVPETVKGASPPRAELALAGGSLYNGTAGVALFLSELARVTARDDIGRVARMALEHAMLHGPGAEDGIPSLHSGTVGLLFAAASYLRHTHDPDLRLRCECLLDGLDSSAVRDPGMDVIAGAAGGIPGLLAIDDVFDRSLVESICTRLGEHLLDAAQVEARGLSWYSGAARGGNLCGLAHGAAGYGMALLELYARTGRTCFRLAAEEAFVYENTWYDQVEGNWADLRNGTLQRYFTEDRLDELRRLPKGDEPLPVYEKKYMSAWCHGAPGIGLSRARAYSILGDERYAREALSTVRATRASLANPHLGHSVCHGFIGNAEALLVVARECRRPGLAAWTQRRVSSVARGVIDGGGTWRSGRLGQVPDVSLMLGEAGIGLFLLGLRHDVVSASYPVARRGWRRRPVEDSEPLRRRIALRCFPFTTSVLDDTGLASVTRASAPQPCTSEWLGGTVEALAKANADLEAALSLDMLLLARERDTPFDRSLHFLRRAFPVGGGDSERLVLAPWVEVIETGGSHGLVFPDARGRWAFRLLPRDLAALILCLSTPRSVDALVEEMQRQTESDPGPTAAWVQRQALNLHGMGIVISSDLATGLAVPQRLPLDSRDARTASDAILAPNRNERTPQIRGGEQ